MFTPDLEIVLFSLSRIGDHVEALAAYRALATLYPHYRHQIEQAYLRDQCDWWNPVEIDQNFAFDPATPTYFKQWKERNDHTF